MAFEIQMGRTCICFPYHDYQYTVPTLPFIPAPLTGYSFLDISRIRGPFWTLGVKPRASGGLVSYLREYPLEENPFLGGQQVISGRCGFRAEGVN